MIIYEKPDYLKVIYNEEKKYITFKWNRFGIQLADLKIAHQEALDTLNKTHSRFYIADTSEVTGALLKPVLDWWSNDWIPVLMNSRLRAVATIMPKSFVAKCATESWQHTNFGKIKLANFTSVEEAEAFFKTIP
jgi:hypothetical protein